MDGEAVSKQIQRYLYDEEDEWFDYEHAKIVAIIDAALAQREAEVREACARVVEEALVPQDCDTDDMKMLAEDIRAQERP